MLYAYFETSCTSQIGLWYSQQTFSMKGKIVNILGYVGQRSVSASQLCHHSVKVATDE